MKETRAREDALAARTELINFLKRCRVLEELAHNELHSTTLKKRSERVTVSFFRSIDSEGAAIYETRVMSPSLDVTVYRGTVRDTAANEYSDAILSHVAHGFKITKIYPAEVDAK